MNGPKCRMAASFGDTSHRLIGEQLRMVEWDFNSTIGQTRMTQNGFNQCTTVKCLKKRKNGIRIVVMQSDLSISFTNSAHVSFSWKN